MAEQQRVEKPTQKRSTEAELKQLAEDDAAVAAAQEKPAADLSDLDDLLDEIDGLLEEQEVLTNFRQKGGQAVRVFLDTVIAGFRAPFVPTLVGVRRADR